MSEQAWSEVLSLHFLQFLWFSSRLGPLEKALTVKSDAYAFMDELGHTKAIHVSKTIFMMIREPDIVLH